MLNVGRKRPPRYLDQNLRRKNLVLSKISILHTSKTLLDFKVNSSESETYLKKWRVGKPLISNLCLSALFSVASTLAIVWGGSCPLSTSAAASYSGASFLQCPLDKGGKSKLV